MKIIELKAQNFMNLKAVEIRPGENDNTVLITGANGAGKTSILDAIHYAFTGKKVPRKPIREGETSAKISVDCGEFISTRTFGEKGSSLVVETKDGAAYKKPQAFLDKLIGDLSFDPMPFINAAPREQMNILSNLVGIDLDTYNQEYAKVYEARTQVGRSVKHRAGALEMAPRHDDAPEKEISSKELFSELEEIRNHNNEIRRTEQCIEGELRSLSSYDTLIAQRKNRIKEIENQIAELKQEILDEKEDIKDTETKKAERQKEIDIWKKKLENMQPKSEDDVTTRINSIDQDNQKYRDNIEHKRLQEYHQEAEKEYETYTAKLKDIEQSKAKELAAAEFPIAGLSFGDACVEFNGVPLDQISSGEKIKVGIAVAMALNPKMRVLRISDGSLLDEQSMQIIQDMAEKNDFQVFIEKVDESGKMGIYIEEGEVKNG